MDIYKVLDLLERVEGQMGELYKQLREEHKLNKEASSFFSVLQLEEESHVQLIRMERRIVQASPKAFGDVSINLSEINSHIENMKSLKTARLKLPELLGRIYGLESSPAEKYLVDALKDTNEDLSELLVQLSGTFKVHAEKVAEFARTLGVEIEAVQDRFLRKARVGYSEGVTINETIQARGVDISEAGLFVLTRRTFPPGTIVRVQFRVHEVPITADAAVQYVIENVGMGLSFALIQDRDRERITQYVERRIEEIGPEKQKRVLLVGNATQAGKDMHIYRHALLDTGCKVVDVAGFEDSVNILERGANFSCIVLLIESETDPNYHLLHLISARDHYRNVPLFVLTNNNEKSFRETVLRKGATKLLMRITTSPKRLTEEVNAVSE
jgi:CheY-like chemotaxis protein